MSDSPVITTCPPATVDFSQMQEAFNLMNQQMMELKSTLGRLYSLRMEEKESYVHRIAQEKSIAAHGDFEAEPVTNSKYNRGRVFLEGIFTPNHSGGLTVELWYTNQKIGDVMVVRSSNGSGNAASEPIDIAYLSGFRFIVRNHDQSQATVIRNFRIVMYTEGNYANKL